jgi:superfamily II DNA or RNA helicase
MGNTLLDNTEKFKLVDFIKKFISDDKCRHIMIATGYWDLPGTKRILDELKTFFKRGKDCKLDLLIGQEPMLRSYQQNPDVATQKFPDFYIKRDINKLSEDYKPVAQLLLDYANEEDENKSQIRIHVYGQGDTTQFLHAKCYIFLGTGYANGIIGSSNFTEKGLQDNAELNYLETQNSVITAPITEYSDSKSHKVWFEEMWSNSEPWTGKFIRGILKQSPIGKAVEEEEERHELAKQEKTHLTPYELYIKYLQFQFGDMIDADTTAILKSYLPKTYSAYDYQLDAVKQGFSIMKRYGGFILGDVVGLGKTVVGLLIIRHFLEQATSLHRPKKILIITPPSIKSGWINTIKDFDKDSTTQIEPCVTFVTTGSIGKVVDDMCEDSSVSEGVDDDNIELTMEYYGLILVDESHNFRNSDSQKYKALNDLIGFSNPTPYVCLLSATPQNNTPKDIYNQIRLFQREPNNSQLPNIRGGKLDTFFNNQVKRFMKARNLPQDTSEAREEARKIIGEVSKEIRDKVLNELVVRRTRSDIKGHYQADCEILKFPTVKGPNKLEYSMDDELQQLFTDTVTAICPVGHGEQFDPNRHIGFYRYSAICNFTNADNKKLYEKRNLTVENITSRLQKIMQILLVKRLESSIAAFKTTLSNLLRYTEVMIDMINHDCVYICPDININKLHAESNGDFEAFKSAVNAKIVKKKGNNRSFVSGDFDSEYLAQLKGDKLLIKALLERWNQNTLDPKFERFKEALIPELFNPAINNPRGLDKPRLVIFTEAIDTQKALARYIKSKGKRVITVSGDNRDKMQEIIAANFDANLAKDKQCNDYDVIVTTEVLAEGVNLHRANVILNYDAPWNATRLMQRIGRVNRIGSKEEFVHVFNFFPSTEGNREIRLIEKAYAKLQSFHEMFGEDNKVFSEREELCEHDLQEITDGEESPFGIYLKELKAYQASNTERYAEIKAITPLNLGGRIIGASDDSALFIFTDNTQGYVSVCVPKSEPENSTHILSALETMEYLHCDDTICFSDYNIPAEDDRLKIAQNVYNRHVSHYLMHNDSRGKPSKALDVLKKLRSRPDVTTDTKKLLKAVELAVSNNDEFTIRMVMQYDVEQLTLFGLDSDINAMLNASFANIKSRATAKRGESHVALFELK